MNYKEKLAAGFAIARRGAPYFDAALTGMVRVEVEGLAASTGIVGAKPTMGVTENGVLMYERAAIEEWSVDEIAGVLIHEVGHLLRDHAKRRKGFSGEHVRWNIAGDLEINDDLVRAGWKLPGDAMTPSRFGFDDGHTAEAYYTLLESKVEYVNCPCGSGAGHAFPNEPDLPGRTEGEIIKIRKQCAESIGKLPGRVPGKWSVWAKETLEPPKIRWQDKLARAARRAVSSRPGAISHTWTRLSRRQAAVGYGPGRPVIPALASGVARVAVCVDTSGSMAQDQLTVALRELAGILSAAGANVRLVVIDAAVRENREVRTLEQAAALMKGGGGTDFRPAFEELRKSRTPPDLIVFATDGYGPAPEKEPQWCSTIWLLISGRYGAAEMPTSGDNGPAITWGEVVRVEVENAKERGN